ncbi:Hypothetical protein BROD_2238 [Brucella sp. NF 2653]|uniref:hypothetical protein n=1 Tax=unclassified Brucella TaxID=2632610 RepID=UPI0001B48CB4|nr:MULTISPECIES: hypothetical protein [unclassified Brucella]EFM61770.1 Hypothetical protein BROD_2238 [Brucella sp. NF 2653]
MGEIHKVYSVTESGCGALLIDADFTGTATGQRMRKVYVLRDGDEFGSAPMFQQWIKENNPTITPYSPPPKPTPEQQRAMLPDLEKWRVDTIIDLEPGLRDKIDAAIDKWPEPKRTIAKNKLKSVTNFRRTDPLFDDIGADPDVGKSPEDIDTMWLAGASLA